MIIISAMSETRVIGSGAGMPWSVPEEYEQYLRLVSGNAVIMGRKTYEIFAADLPDGTDVIVVTRRPTIAGAQTAASLERAIEIGSQSGKLLFVAGGGSIYEQALPLADQMYLSTIKGDFQGDAYFPAFNSDDWVIAEEYDHPKFVFRIYRRR